MSTQRRHHCRGPPPSASSPTISRSVSGIGIAVFTAIVRRHSADHRMAQRERDPPRGVRQHPRPAQGRVLHGDPGDVGVGCVPVREPHEELGARCPRPTSHDRQERQAAGRRLPRRRVHADAAARFGRRPDALDDLLRVPRADGRHDDPRGRPPATRGAQVPARPHLPGVFVRRRPRRRSSSWSASCGRSCGATCSGRTGSASSPSPSTP